MAKQIKTTGKKTGHGTFRAKRKPFSKFNNPMHPNFK